MVEHLRILDLFDLLLLRFLDGFLRRGHVLLRSSRRLDIHAREEQQDVHP